MEQNNLPVVSLVIPCRNEEKFIEKCLESILNQDYPKEKIEVLVVDGMSEDRTREKIKNFQFLNPNFQLRLIDNPKKITPAAMNIGIKNSKGEIIIKIDAHSTYSKDYISKCVKYLLESGANCVGGIIKTLPSENTILAKAIALSLSHPFGVGSSYFRRGIRKLKFVDTVAFGCYKKEIFDRLGLYNEKAERIEDLELNSRIRKSGGKILLVPEIVAFYYPKSNLKDFFKHNFSDGFWTTYSFKIGLRAVGLRHLIPLFFVLTLPISLWPYILLSLIFSAQIAILEKDFRLFFLMPIAFFCRHFSYGLGSIFGLIKFLKEVKI
jgi:glycosyltransferase involved in cell wall biosynthesis